MMRSGALSSMGAVSRTSVVIARSLARFEPMSKICRRPGAACGPIGGVECGNRAAILSRAHLRRGERSGLQQKNVEAASGRRAFTGAHAEFGNRRSKFRTAIALSMQSRAGSSICTFACISIEIENLFAQLSLDLCSMVARLYRACRKSRFAKRVCTFRDFISRYILHGLGVFCHSCCGAA